ncbi:MAG: ABC transporter ATP-binding protein/permease [Candidatus Izemoplasmatales bacterium]|nr:ABC transporter ATP-binding protein/permease [Candidatus Izemoplasmatales bacterium]
MISLKNISKYYNKGRSNQIHVINDTSIDFPKTGLVALTGPSGCGKTTLLNVVGGLDGFNSGKIIFDDKEIRTYHSQEWDILRNEKIGYIFQNYNLVLSKTVYENIELALNMAGLYEKKEIEERINYVLEAVGMYNYRRRNVKALSGGQQQRVAIARALVKDPEVVLADEPTGNLDSNNTFEIMSIIKKISETRLVILVTHEKGLVDFYADRVIELLDGKIVNDYENTSSGAYDYNDERIIYLKDLNSDDRLKDSGIEHYYDTEKDKDLNIKLIEYKGNLYIKVNSKRKIKYLSDNSEIKLLDEHYKTREINEATEYDFDLSTFKEIKTDKNRKSFIKWSSAIKSGFSRIFSKRKFSSKLFLFGYMVISAILAYQIASFGSLTYMDQKDYIQYPKETMMLNPRTDIQSINFESLLNEIDGIEVSPYFSSVYLKLNYKDYYQGNTNINFDSYPVKVSQYQNVEVLQGGLPNNNYQVALDLWVVEEIFEEKNAKDIGLDSYEEIIGSFISLGWGEKEIKYEIVGIVNSESPILILDDDAIYAFHEFYQYFSVLTYGEAEGKIEIVSGRNITSNNEMLAPDYEGYEVGTEYDFQDSFGKMTIVGTYKPADNDQAYNGSLFIITNQAYQNAIEKSLDSENFYYGNVYFFVEDQEKAVQDFAARDLELINTGDYYYDDFETSLLAVNGFKITRIVVIIIGIVIYIYFMMRSSMLNRIKEIGVYRAIGASKRDIYKIFLSEIIAFTIVGSVISYFAMSFILLRLQASVSEYLTLFVLPPHLFIGGIVGIFVLNIVFGMLPIITLLIKKPAEITSKYDI